MPIPVEPAGESDLPADLLAWIQARFGPDEIAEAKAILAHAVLHTGERPTDRQLRAAAIGSQGTLAKLEYLVGLLKVDWRDVIVAGEYEVRNGQLVRVCNLELPIDPGWPAPVGVGRPQVH